MRKKWLPAMAVDQLDEIPSDRSHLSGLGLVKGVCAMLVAFAFLPLQISAQVQQDQFPSGIHEVEVTARGVDEEAALKAAFVKALERTVGAMVYSSTTVENFQIESDVQKLLTNGCIESYDEISSRRENGEVVKTICARVQRGMVADFMRRSGYSAATDLSDIWARLSTSIRGKKQALEMLHAKMPEIRDALYKVNLVDLSDGHEVAPGSLAKPFTQENLEGDVVCIWPAVVKPDCHFRDTRAAPLLAACFDALCEKEGRLFVNMNTGVSSVPPLDGQRSAGFESFTRAPLHRWQRISPASPPAWKNGRPIERPDSAPHCIALETRSRNPDCLDLSLFFFSDEVFSRLMNPPEVRNAQGEVIARPEGFQSLRTGLKADLRIKGDQTRTFTIEQKSPLFQRISLPWTGNIQAMYCGPYFPAGSLVNGWSENSRWPDWQGPVKPDTRTPGFAPFLIHQGRIYLANGRYQDALQAAIEQQRREDSVGIPDCQFDLEVIVPLVFKIRLDELRRVEHLSAVPLTGPPPFEPGISDTLMKAFKAWLSK
jgi:hypothetical protein